MGARSDASEQLGLLGRELGFAARLIVVASATVALSSYPRRSREVDGQREMRVSPIGVERGVGWALEDAQIATAAGSTSAGRPRERYFTIVKLSLLVVECCEAVLVAVITSV